MTLVPDFPDPEAGNPNFVSGEYIASSQANGNFDWLRDWLNGGNITDVNIASGGLSAGLVIAPASIDDALVSDPATDPGVSGISGSKIWDNTIDGDHIVDDSIQDRHVTALLNPADVTNGIDGQKLHTSSITSDKLDPSILFPGGVPAGSVDTVQLVDNAVTFNKMADNSVGTDELIAGSVTGSKLNTVLGNGVAIQDTSALFMIGEVKDLIVPGTPAGWLVCDGSAVSQVTYSELWDAMGNTHIYGADPGFGDFVLPDLRDRTTIGTGSNVLTANDQQAFGTRSMNIDHTHTNSLSIDGKSLNTASAFDEASRYETGYLLNEQGAIALVGGVAGFGLTSTNPSSDGGGGSIGVDFTKKNHYHEVASHNHTISGGINTTNDASVTVPFMAVTKIIFVNA